MTLKKGKNANIDRLFLVMARGTNLLKKKKKKEKNGSKKKKFVSML